MNKAYLLIGGNMGNREHFLLLARRAIAERCGRICKISALYQTEAWGIRDQPPFLNQAIEIETKHMAEQLLTILLGIEQDLGRKRDLKYGPRTIDIDIMLFNDDCVETTNLTIPHPQLPHRRFALECLAEIASETEHPVLKKTVQQLLSACTDPLTVHKIS